MRRRRSVRGSTPSGSRPRPSPVPVPVSYNRWSLNAKMRTNATSAHAMYIGHAKSSAGLGLCALRARSPPRRSREPPRPRRSARGSRTSGSRTCCRGGGGPAARASGIRGWRRRRRRRRRRGRTSPLVGSLRCDISSRTRPRTGTPRTRGSARRLVASRLVTPRPGALSRAGARATTRRRRRRRASRGRDAFETAARA